MSVTVIDRRAIPEGASFSTWTAADGWSIRRLDWPQPAASRGSLLFANGRGDFIEKYVEPLVHWHRRGWNVTSFDWRSQGRSRGNIRNGHLENFDPLVADGAAFLDGWIASTPAPHVAIGHSMGGHLLLRVIAEHRPNLARAVLVAPMIGINSGPLPPAMAQAIAQGFCLFGWGRMPVWKERDPNGRSQRAKFLTTCPDRYSDELWWFQQDPAFELGAPSWGWLSAAYRSIAEVTPERLRDVQTPLLLIGTERDRLVSAAAIRWAAGLLPNAELFMYPDAAHELLRESDPVRLDALARIDSFAESRESA